MIKMNEFENSNHKSSCDGLQIFKKKTLFIVALLCNQGSWISVNFILCCLVMINDKCKNDADVSENRLKQEVQEILSVASY